MNIIVFSKNRAMQLHGCISSLKKNFKEFDSSNIFVIYSYDKDHKSSLEQLVEEDFKNDKNINWIKQSFSLKQDVLNCFNSSHFNEDELSMFLVDDILFKNPFSLNDDVYKMLDWPGVLTISLRLDKNITHCYALDKFQAVPIMKKNCAWDWRKEFGDWNYPGSVDGNIYKSHTIKQIIEKIEFNNPNEFESRLNELIVHSLKEQYPHMCCYVEQSKLFNVPANRVQNINNNRVENSFSSEELLNLFNRGYRINISELHQIQNNSCHWPMMYEFIKIK